MDESQVADFMELVDDLKDIDFQHIVLAIDSIYAILLFSLVIGAGGFLIYIGIWKPIKIFMNGGFI